MIHLVLAAVLATAFGNVMLATLATAQVREFNCVGAATLEDDTFAITFALAEITISETG